MRLATTSSDTAGHTRYTPWALAAIAAVAVLTSAWYGYSRQTVGQALAAAPASSAASTGGVAVADRAAGANDALEEHIESARVAAPRPAASQALGWPFWEFKFRQPIPPRDPPLTPGPWRMLGATQSGGVWSILIVRQGKASPEYYKVGDSLPGDYRISAITEEDVTLVKDRKAIVLSYIGTR